MILPLHTDLRRAIASALDTLYGLAPDAMPPIVIEYPPNRKLGDLAVTVAFDLARTLRKAPRLIAAEIAEAVTGRADLGRLEATGAGYLNLFLDRPRFARARIGVDPPAPAAGERAKTIVEHTAINPNKAAHVGHLRNAALGDTLCRLLRFRGPTSRCRTTSTTPACRWPTWWSVCASSRGRTSTTCAGSPESPGSTTTAGTSTRG